MRLAVIVELYSQKEPVGCTLLTPCLGEIRLGALVIVQLNDGYTGVYCTLATAVKNV